MFKDSKSDNLFHLSKVHSSVLVDVKSVEGGSNKLPAVVEAAVPGVDEIALGDDDVRGYVTKLIDV